MKQKLLRLLLASSLMLGFFGINLTAFAATPSLTASLNGSSLILTVNNADPSASVSLFQKQSSQFWSSITNIGQTNSSGYFSITLPVSWDGSSNALQLYVLVNNSQSSIVQLYQNSGSTGSLSLSQTSVNISSGQTVNVTAYPSSGSIYVSANSNPSIASSALNGNQISIYGSQTGVTTITFCSNSSQCGGIVVTVNGGSGILGVTPTSINVGIGQTATAAILNSTGTPYIASNSNSNIASAGINNQTITVYGIALGSTTINICQSGVTGGCVNLTVIVGSSSSTTTSGLTFSVSNPVLSVGQNQSVSSIISPDGSTSFFIASNTNVGSVGASVNGSLLVINAISPGSSTVMVCENNSNYCGSIYITVSNLNGAINFSQTNLSLTPGQNTIVTISGGSGNYYLSSNTNPSVASAVLNGSSLSVTGIVSGTTSLAICQSGSTAGCNNVSVSVGSASGGTVSFSTTNPILTVGQSQTINIYSSNGYSGGFTVSGSTNSNVVSSTINGSALTVYGNSAGSTYLTICQNGNSVCSGLTVTVNSSSTLGSGGAVSFASNSLPTGVVGQYYSYQMQANGGTGSYTYSITAGSLPTGLALSRSGLISGTVSSNTSSSFTVFVVDSSGSGTAAQFSINILGSSTYTPPVTTGTDNPGTNVNNNGTIYMITNNGQKRPYTSAGAFLSYGFNSWSNVVVASAADMNLPTGNFIPPRDGKIVCSDRGSDKGTCYLISNSQKAAFTSQAVFIGLGFSFAQSLTGDVSFLPSTSNISDVTQAHLPGTLINKGGTVCLVGNNGILGVPDLNTLSSWGYSFSDVVLANAADSAKSQTGVMPLRTPGLLSPFGN